MRDQNLTTADEATLTRQIDRVETARAAANKTRSLMLVQMVKVLTPEQRASTAMFSSGRVARAELNVRIQEGLASGRAIADLCRENRVWGEPRTSLVSRAARNLDRRVLQRALARAAHIDRVARAR